MKSRTLAVVSFILCFIFSLSASAVKTVTAVNAYEHQGRFVTEIQFAEPISPEDLSLQYINQTVQVEIPDAQLLKGTLKRPINHSRVKSLYTYEPKQNLVYSRIIQHKPHLAEDLKDNIEVEIKDNIAFVRISEPQSVASNAKAESIVVPPNSLATKLPEKESVKLSVGEILAKEIAITADEMLEEEDTIKREPAIVKKDAEKLKKQAVKAKAEVKSENKDFSNLPESEIPVLTAKKADPVEVSGSMGKMFYSLIIIALMAAGIAYFTRWWSKRHTKSLDNNKIRVLTQHHLGPKKSLSIIQVAGETILIGVTDHNINMIKTLSLLDEELPEFDPTTTFSESLDANIATDAVLDKVSFNNSKKKKSDDVDEFALGNIKDIVSNRLKDMRPL